VDSCIDSTTGSSVPLSYLTAIGVDPARAVELVVASHWHDDHVRGLSEVVKVCRNAAFVCANVLTQQEFYRYVERYAAGNLAVIGTGVGEFQRVHQILADSVGSRPKSKWAGPDRRLLSIPGNPSRIGCDVWSLSPSDAEYRRFLDLLAREKAQEREPKRRAVAHRPNDASVVLALDWGPASALLGSDLETFHGEDRGWGAIVSSTGRPQGKGTFLKVPHHGGLSAHHEGMWSQMLVDQPISVLTPFSRGTTLPSPDDKSRILGYSPNAYTTARITSRGSRVGVDRAVDKTLAEAKITIRKPPSLGLVRSRFVGGMWVPELFNDACHLSAA